MPGQPTLTGSVARTPSECKHSVYIYYNFFGRDIPSSELFWTLGEGSGMGTISDLVGSHRLGTLRWELRPEVQETTGRGGNICFCFQQYARHLIW